MFTLASVTSLGIIIGMVVTDHADEEGNGTKAYVILTLQGLAAGTLLYITFYEVLDRQKLDKAGMTGCLGAFLIFFGFAIMAGLESLGMYKAMSCFLIQMQDINNASEIILIIVTFFYLGGHSHGVTEKGHNHGSNSSMNGHIVY